MTPAYPSPRAVELVARFGRDTVAAQALGASLHHWFGDGDALVAFVDTGGAWVAAGSPICAPDRVAEVAAAFTEAARSANRRACFFAAEQDLGMTALPIGEQAVWNAARWGIVLAGAQSLRYQISRARNHGVDIDEQAGRDELAALVARWQARHAMPPMGFLVALEPHEVARTRRIFVARQDGAIVGFAASLALPARGRVFVEHLVRRPDAPNGTIELLFDAMITDAGERELDMTLGLAPLSGPAIPSWLRASAKLGRGLYDFAGLRAFKAKLRPDAWEPVALVTRGSRTLAVYDALRAFACGPLLAFGARTAARRWRRWRGQGTTLPPSPSPSPLALPPG